VIFQNEPIFSSRRCDRLMLIKVSKLVELANMNFLAGKAIQAKPQEARDSTKAKTDGGKLIRKLALILSLWYEAN